MQAMPESDLIIDPGPQRISGANQAMSTLRGKFMKTIDVQLGDLLTDAAGRLIVLGGHGQSQSLPSSTLEDFADNDGWCDDAADGPVRATVRLHGSAAPIAADPAWVIVAPPDFAPAIENVVTLYDAVYNVMARFDPRLAVSDTTKSLSPKTSIRFCDGSRTCIGSARLRRHATVKARTNALHLATERVVQQQARDDAARAAKSFRPCGSRTAGGGNMPKLPDLAVQEAPGASLTDDPIQADGALGAGASSTPIGPGRACADAARPVAGAGSAAGARPRRAGSVCRRALLSRNRGQPGHARRGDLRQKAPVPHQRRARPRHADRSAWPCRGRPTSTIAASTTARTGGPASVRIEVRRGQDTHGRLGAGGLGPAQDMVKKWSQLGFVVAKTVANKVQYVEDERPSSRRLPVA